MAAKLILFPLKRSTLMYTRLEKPRSHTGNVRVPSRMVSDATPVR